MLGKRHMKVSIGVTAAVVLAAGCTADGSDDDQDVPSNAVVIGIAEPAHLLPTNVTDPSGLQVLSALVYPLVGTDGTKEPVPLAATSITSKDNVSWTVELAPDLTFGNGERVIADNYIDAWNYGAYGPNAQKATYFFSRIDGYADLQSKDPDGSGPQQAPAPGRRELTGLRKVDDHTFTVQLSAPFSGWRSVLGSTAFAPLPKAAFSAPGVLAEGFEDTLVGNGPFRMAGRWEHGRQIRLERVTDFRGTPAKVDGITYKIYPNPQAQYADLLAGNIDVQPDIPIDKIASAPQDLGTHFGRSPNSIFNFLGFPAYEKDLTKPDVRKAISMAIDRQALTSQIFLDSQTPATAFVPPVVAGYRADSCGAACAYDPVKAKQLYTSAGGPAEITVSYNADGGHQAWVEPLCAQIRAALGIGCVPAAEKTFNDLLATVGNEEPVGLIRLSWVMDYPLMESYLGPLFTTGGSWNLYGYSSPEFDAKVAEGSAATTPAAAVKSWQQAEDILARDMPVIPLRFGQNVYGSSERVANVVVNPLQQVDVYQIEVVS